MGDYFKTIFSTMSQVEGQEMDYKRRMDQAVGEVSSVRSALSGSIKNQQGINDALGRIIGRMETQAKDFTEMSTALSSIRQTYKKTDNEIAGFSTPNAPSAADWDNALHTLGQGLALSAINPVVGLGYVFGKILADGENTSKTKIFKYKQELKDFDDWKKDLRDDKYEWDSKNKKFVKKPEEKKDGDKDKEKKKKGAGAYLDNVTIASGSVGREGELLGWDDEQETDWGSYGYDVDVMHAEATAGYAVTAGTVMATVGVGITAFSAEAQGQLGDDMLGAHGSAKVEVGSAEAKAKIDAGIWDKDGNLDVHASAGVSAEAVAAKVSGTVGADVLGTKVDATGELGVGIGAHAKVEVKGGKISADIGAYVGVGGSVNLEIDISGTIKQFDKVCDTVSNCASAVGNAVGDAYNAAADFVGDVGSSISKGISKLWPF